MTAADRPSTKAHHMLRFIDLQCRIEKRSLAELSRTSGVSYTAIKLALKGKRQIGLLATEALLNALGFSMKPVPMPTKSYSGEGA